MKLTINSPRPLFRRDLRQAPGLPLGNRVLVREFPPESKSEGGLEMAEVAKQRYFAGTLIAAGDQAADKLYDLGVELGDEVWFGQYAGLIQQWQHIVGDLDVRDCHHEGAWDLVPREDHRWRFAGTPDDNRSLRACRGCGTLKLTERVIVMSVEDLCVNVDLQARLEAGHMRRVRGQDAQGRTRYVIVRMVDSGDCYEMIKKGA